MLGSGNDIQHSLCISLACYSYEHLSEKLDYGAILTKEDLCDGTLCSWPEARSFSVCIQKGESAQDGYAYVDPTSIVRTFRLHQEHAYEHNTLADRRRLI